MEAVDESLTSFKSQFSTLRALGKSLFPGSHFIDVNFIEIPRINGDAHQLGPSN